jgi:hypothetical protein
MAENDEETAPNRVFVKIPGNWRALTDDQKGEFAERALALLKEARNPPRHDA